MKEELPSHPNIVFREFSSEVYEDFINMQRKEAGYCNGMLLGQKIPSIEYLPEDNFEEADAYKVSYRTCSVLVWQFKEKYLNNEMFVWEEAIHFLKGIPYFNWLFTQEGIDNFSYSYHRNFYELYMED